MGIMKTEFQPQFEIVQHQRSDLEKEVLTLTDEQLNWTPNPNAWSIRQIIQHLVLSDETVGQARGGRALVAEALPFRVLPRAWRRAMILSAFRHNVVLPLPSPEVEPREYVGMSDLLLRWDVARGDMARDLDTLRGDEAPYSHPVLGPLTALQMLELEQAHVAYHARQIKALRLQSAFHASTRPTRDFHRVYESTKRVTTQQVSQSEARKVGMKRKPENDTRPS